MYTISNLFASMAVVEKFFISFQCHLLHLLQVAIELDLLFGVGFSSNCKTWIN